jgi:secreted trypsin-like serine protease
MSVNKVIRAPLWATLLAALVTAMVVAFFVFVQSGEAAGAADERPSAKAPKIIGGKPAPNGKYRFMAALVNPTRPGTFSDQQFCGGSLIDKNSVLTAGHCVFGDPPFAPPGFTQTPQNTQVIVGRSVLNSDQGKVRNVKDIYVHPLYKGLGNPVQSHDVAVLALSRPVSGNTPIKPATSRQNYLERPGRDAKVAGWGSTTRRPACGPGPKPEFASRVREARVPIISDSKAGRAYRQLPQCAGVTAFVPRLMIAAGGKGKDTCQGDSGSPLFGARAPDGSGSKYTQIGITSFGPGCAYKDFPGAYTEVNNPSIRSFITRAARK